MKITEDPEILKVLGLETLEERKMDSLDFHDTAVWVMAQALELAYQKGYEKGVYDHARNGQ